MSLVSSRIEKEKFIIEKNDREKERIDEWGIYKKRILNKEPNLIYVDMMCNFSRLFLIHFHSSSTSASTLVY